MVGGRVGGGRVGWMGSVGRGKCGGGVRDAAAGLA